MIISGYFPIEQASKKWVIEFPIDSPEEAIAFVKSHNSSLKKSIEAIPKQVDVWAVFDEENNQWEAGITRIGIKNGLYLMQFSPDGTVIFEGYVPGG